MKYPKILETREDYDYVIKNFPREIWLPDYKELFDNAFYSKVIGKNAVVKDGIATFDDISEEEAKEVQENSNKWKDWKELDVNNHLEFSDKYNDVILYKGKLYITSVRLNPESKMAKLGFNEDEAYEYMLGLTKDDLSKLAEEGDLNV